MPFGKNKGLSMPRPIKNKVPAREEASEISDVTGVTGTEVDATHPPPPEHPHPSAVAPSPGRLKRKQAESEWEDLHGEWQAWEELNGEAERELAVALRLYDAKQRRIVKAQKGKRHGSPFNELERIYKAELELVNAKLKRSEIDGLAQNAECNMHAQKCRMLRQENAKLRRLLREHDHNRVCV